MSGYRPVGKVLCIFVVVVLNDIALKDRPGLASDKHRPDRLLQEAHLPDTDSTTRRRKCPIRQVPRRSQRAVGNQWTTQISDPELHLIPTVVIPCCSKLTWLLRVPTWSDLYAQYHREPVIRMRYIIRFKAGACDDTGSQSSMIIFTLPRGHVALNLEPHTHRTTNYIELHRASL